jgi:hypothetical protein
MPGKNKVAVFDLTVSKTFEVESEGEDESQKSEKDKSEEDQEFKYFMHGDAVLNLKDYNEKRRGYLHEWHVPIEEDEADNDDENEAVEEANRLKANPCTGNLEISLFWEEKILIIVRVLQLYSVFFIYYFEHWPSKTR